jgi:hypothetical protein
LLIAASSPKKESKIPLTSTYIHLTLAGKDALDRDFITVYDITDYLTANCSLFTKQISDFPIKHLRYLDNKNPNVLVSSGKGNICFWHMKNKFLTIQPINLNEHSFGNIFTCIDVLRQKSATKTPTDPVNKASKYCYFVYVASSLGFLYLIDYSRGEMKTVMKLHNVPFLKPELNHIHKSVPEPQLHRHWWS